MAEYSDAIQFLCMIALAIVAVWSMRLIFVSQKRRDHMLGIAMYMCVLAITVTMVFRGWAGVE